MSTFETLVFVLGGLAVAAFAFLRTEDKAPVRISPTQVKTGSHLHTVH